VTEEWRDIPGHAGYQVSSLGRVRSLDRFGSDGRIVRGVIKALRYTDDGYLRVSFATGRRSVKTTHTVADLVLLVFAGPKPSGAVIRHLDGVRDNNALCNLVYGTPAESGADTARHGKLTTSRRGYRQGPVISAATIKQVKEAPSGREAARMTGISATHAKDVRAGRIPCWADR